MKSRLREELRDFDSENDSEANQAKIGDIQQPVFDLGNAAARNHPAGKLQLGSQHLQRPTVLVPQPADLASDDIELFHATYAK
jgi:hypothetical protein